MLPADQTTTVLGIVIPSSEPFFLGLIGVHVAFGLTCVVAGALAMLAQKGRGRHSTLGTIYFWSMCGLFATMTLVSIMRWSEDRVLFALGAAAFIFATSGRIAASRQIELRIHAVCMGASYIVLLTAFYVDNGKNLPVWRDLPVLAYWLLPALFGVPLMLWALSRHPLLRGPSASER